MTARQILAEVTARADVLPAEKWTVDGTCVAVETGSCNCGAGDGLYGHERHCGIELLAEIGHAETAVFIATARQDVPALAAALTAVLDRAEPGGWIEALITAHLDPTAGGPDDATGPSAVAASGGAA